jgi:hypothetical protein
MFKKSILIAMTLITSSHSFAALSSEEGDSFLTRVEKSVFELVYFGASPLIMPVGYIFEIKGRMEARNAIVAAADDMTFFGQYVTSATPNEYGMPYEKIVIQPQAGDVITNRSATIENTGAPMTFEAFSGVFISINGRKLVSDKVAKAHEAAKNLIYNGVIEVPEQLRSGENKDGVWVAANDAAISNALALKEAKEEIAAKQRILKRTK